MKKLISELRELIDNKHRLMGISRYAYADFDEKLTEMEAKIAREPKPKKPGKFVELIDEGFTILIRKKDICTVGFRKESFDKVYISMKKGHDLTLIVSENKEVLENLIEEFKG